MQSIYYKNLPDYMANSNYVINIQDIGGSSNASGLNTLSALQTSVNNIQQMVDYTRKQINVNIISNFDTSPIQVVAPMNLSNVSLFQDGTLFSGTGAITTGGTTILSSGTTALILSNASTSTSNVFTFTAGPGYSTIMTLDQYGTLSLPYGASPNKYLECMDNIGTTQWNYVSNVTQGNSALFRVLADNSFSFQENAYEIASLDSNGNMTAQNFFSVSDKRYKDNISTLTNAGEMLKQIRGVSFNWKRDGTHDIGVIAQEVYNVVPEAIVSTNNNMLTVAYNKIIPLLIETIKDLQVRVEALEQKKSVSINLSNSETGDNGYSYF